MKKFYIINSNYYDEISKRLLKGAENFCNKNKIEYRVIDVAGALEIPSAINIINENIATKVDGVTIHSDSVGFIALGCVIKGETSHYDIVTNQSAYGLTELAMSKNIILGNSILTVDNYDQALKRSKDDETNKAYHAAKACNRLIDIKNGKI